MFYGSQIQQKSKASLTFELMIPSIILKQQGTCELIAFNLEDERKIIDSGHLMASFLIPDMASFAHLLT